MKHTGPSYKYTKAHIISTLSHGAGISLQSKASACISDFCVFVMCHFYTSFSVDLQNATFPIPEYKFSLAEDRNSQ